MPFTGDVVIRARRSTTSTSCSSDRGLPDDHAPNGRHGGARDRDVTSSWRSRSPSTWPGCLAADAGVLVVAIIVPLWASYLVKVYAWRVILTEDGDPQLVLARSASRARASVTSRSGSSSRYLWLPFMILPIYAGLERIPGSLLEASADLGGRGVA